MRPKLGLENQLRNIMIITKNKTHRHSLGKGFLSQSFQNESGVALVVALLLMAVMIALVPAAMQMTTGETDRTQNFKENREAFFIAEAGLEHAKALTEASSLRAALAGPDDLVTAISGITADDDDNGTFGIGTQVTRPDGNLYDEVALNGNTYYIRAYDNDDGNADFDIDNIIILHSVGIVDGITTTVEAEVYNPPGIPVSAVTTNGNLTISGNPGITGNCGSAHANGDLDISGNPTIDENATASGSYLASGSPSVGGTSGGSLPNINIPLLDPTQFEPYADYTLAADGNVYDASGTFVGSSPWNGWDYSSPKWTLSGNSAIDAFYYIEGDTVISGTPGSPGTPWEVTIVATGFIEISGNPRFINKKNPSDPVDIQNIFMLAGTDVKYNGNANQTIDGIIYATEQISLSGNPNINGAVMAYDSFSVEGLVSQNGISGDPNITYGCGLTVPSGSVTIEVISWNEL